MIDVLHPVPDTSFIHPDATVVGNVKIGEYASIWPGAVVRGDLNTITIGNYVNIQDHSILHVDSDSGIEIGDYSLIGHMVILHGCKIGKAVMVGIRTMIMDDAEIGDGSMIASDCVISGKMKIPPFSLVKKVGGEIKIYPGKARTLLTIIGSLEYAELARRHKEGNYTGITQEEFYKLKEKARKIYEELFPGQPLPAE